MRYSFTIHSDSEEDLDTVLRTLINLYPLPASPSEAKIPAPVADKMVQPDRIPTEAPKPKGRPRKPEAAAPEAAPEAAPANGPDAQLSDQGMLSTVGNFCAAHPDKTAAISEMLRVFGVERITHLTPEQRQPFLTKLEALA
jgi:hypothetical protein